MKICVDCKVEMKCDKNGVGARRGTSHVYAGDRFVCPKCGHKILVADNKPIHDQAGCMAEYLQMD